MNTEPVGAITDIGVGPSLEVRRAQSARLAFSVVLLFASLFVVAIDEARRWQPAIDLGMQLDDEDNRVIAVTADGPAERAGIGVWTSVISIDGVDLLYQQWRRERFADTLILSRQGNVYARAGVSSVVLRAQPADQKMRDSLCARRATIGRWDSCSGDALDANVVVAGPQKLVRDPLVLSPWRVVAALPFVALLAIAAAAMTCRLVRRRDGIDRRRVAFVWMAVSATVVVPMWLHVSLLALFATNDELSTLCQMALLTTVPAWVVLVLTAATAAARAAEGDSATTSLAPLAVATVIPVLFFILPGACVAFVSLVLLHGLRRWQLRVLAREAPPDHPHDVVMPG